MPAKSVSFVYTKLHLAPDLDLSNLRASVIHFAAIDCQLSQNVRDFVALCARLGHGLVTVRMSEEEEKIDGFFTKSSERSQQLMIVLKLTDVLRKKLDQGFSRASLHQMMKSEFGFKYGYRTFCKMLRKYVEEEKTDKPFLDKVATDQENKA